jgi:hypothetical protein
MENCAMTVQRTNSKVCDAQTAYFVEKKLVLTGFFGCLRGFSIRCSTN